MDGDIDMTDILNKITPWFVVIIACLVLHSCNENSSPFPDNDNRTDSDVQETTYLITVQLLDPDSGIEIDEISFGYPGKLRITVNESNGQPARNKLITASTTKGSFAGSPDGTTVTNSSGIAELILQAGLDTGAGEISIKIGDYTWDDTFAFKIGVPAEIKLGSFDGGDFTEGVLLSSIAGDEVLAIGSSATVTASFARLNGSVYEPFDTSTPVSFTTSCSGANTSNPKYEGNGTTSAVYSAGDCSATSDTITASANIFGTNLSALCKINLATPELGSIEFVSAVPTHIALQGTATPERPSNSVVSFKVKDANGNPLQGVTVEFTLETEIGGLTVASSDPVTDSDGITTAVVTAGVAATTVRVVATAEMGGVTVYSRSSELVVSTGLPDQDSFSLSVESLNPEAWDYNGVTMKVTANAADHFNNPVPDGTAIYFTTEGGMIEPFCTTKNGSCWVTWTSQAPRPNGSEYSLPGEDRAGRATILATAIGEESFQDNNGNGFFDPSNDTRGDDLPEAFRDDDESGYYSGNEFYFNSVDDGSFTPSNSMYNGTLCNHDTLCTDELVDVRENIVIVMSSRDAGEFYFRPLPDGDPSDDLVFDSADGWAEVELYLADKNGNSMPKGSKVYLISPDNAEIVGATEFEILDATEPATYTITLQTKVVDEPGKPGLLGAWVQTPIGTISDAPTIQVIVPTP